MNQGFTLLEILIAIGILVLVALVTLPVSYDTYRDFVLDSETKNLVSLLRRARGMSIVNQFGSSFGIKLREDDFVIFRGSDFSSRDSKFDELYPREQSITISGFNEISFRALSGNVTPTSTIELANDTDNRVININNHGGIDW